MKKRKKIWLIISAIVVIILIIFFVFNRDKDNDKYSVVEAKSGDLLQTVSEVGTVEPIKELSLRFANSGKIGGINVDVGDNVTENQILAVLDKESLELKKIEAQANLKIAESGFSKTIEGSSEEDVNISLSELEQAKNNIESAEKELEQIKKTVEEDTKQAEKTLIDLESGSSNTKTAKEQAVYSAQVSLDNAKKTGELNLDNTRNSVLLILNDKILVGKVALDHLNTILNDDDAKNLLGAKNQKTVINTKLSIKESLEGISELENVVSRAQETQSFADINNAGLLLKDFLIKTNQSLNYAFSMLEATVTSSDFSKTDLEAYKSLVITQNSQVSSALNTLESGLQSFNTAKINYETSVATAEENLNQAEVALEDAIVTANNNLNTITLSGERQISKAESNLEQAKKTVDLAEARLEKVSAGPRSQDISLAQAQVSQAQAALDNIESQLEDRIIYAPLDGVITKVNYNVGEQYGVSGPEVIGILADNNFEINVDISESDINKIAVNDQVDVSLDAFSEDIILPAKVAFIEPAQTLIQGVVYYKVKILFSDSEKMQEILTENNLSLKSGMTANITINTDKKENVIYIPGRAIIEEEGKKIVRVLNSNDVVERKQVETGLRGDGGLVEIISGLKVGEKVITFIRNSED